MCLAERHRVLPRFGAVIIPDLFFELSIKARTEEWNTGSAASFREYRDSKGKVYKPARMFPPPGKPLSFLGSSRVLIDDDKTPLTGAAEGGGKVKMLPEIEYLVRIIETVQPVRIVSIHGKRPRTPEDLDRANKKCSKIDISN